VRLVGGSALFLLCSDSSCSISQSTSSPSRAWWSGVLSRWFVTHPFRDYTRRRVQPPEFFGSQALRVHAELRLASARALTGARTGVDTVRSLRRWVHAEVKRFRTDAELRGHSIDPVTILADLRSGFCANCGPLSVLLIETLRANGFAARQVLIAESPPFRRGFGHALVEVWADDRLIAQDPTFGTEWRVRGQPASALEIVYARRANGPVEIFADGPPDPRLQSTFIEYGRSVTHVLVVRERSPLARSVARWPFAKLAIPSIVELSHGPDDGTQSPFTFMTVLAWIVYSVIPAAGIIALWLLLRGPHDLRLEAPARELVGGQVAACRLRLRL